MIENGPRKMNSEINVTPMIDILLVLLIVFMVIVPSVPKGESALIPKSSLKSAPSEGNPIVLEVSKGDGGQATFKINQQSVALRELPARLAAIYANRAQRVMFVKGDDRLSFDQVAEVIDIGHAAGIDHIGLMTPKVQAGQ
jgi:biopolymer transport protein ExbD